MANERELRPFSGWLLLCVFLLLAAALTFALVDAARDARILEMFGWLLLLALAAICLAGLTGVNPNEAKVVTLFGVYKVRSGLLDSGG